MSATAWRGRRVLVTGATGIVGSWVVKALLERGATVVALCVDLDPQSELVRSGDVHKVKQVYGSLEDYAAVERAVGAWDVDTVVHLGAQTLVGNSLPNSPETKATVGANYTFDLGAGSLTFSGTYSYTDDLQSSVFSNPIYTADANEIADFRILWNDAENRYTIVAFVKNAFDEEAYLRSTGSSPTAVGSRRRAAK